MSALRSSKLTVIVPTHDRPRLLARLLTYWAEQSLKTSVVIADSSSAAERVENQGLAESFSECLSLQYRYLNTGLIEKCNLAAESVTTPYIAVCSDDEFLLPDAILSSVAWLDEHPDYACAQGLTVGIDPNRNDRYRLSRRYSIDAEEPWDRICEMIRHTFSTDSAVYPTSVLRCCLRMALRCPDYLDARVYSRLMIAAATTLQGRIAVLPHLYSVQQQQHIGKEETPVEDQAHAAEHYARFRQVLIRQVVRYTDVAEEQVASLVDAAYGSLARGQLSPTGFAAMDKAIATFVRRLRNRDYAERVLEDRLLSSSDPLCNDPAFRQALQLIEQHPHGVSNAETPRAIPSASVRSHAA